MSMPTLIASADGFDDLEFELIVADFRPDPDPDPDPEPSEPAPPASYSRRLPRGTEKRLAINAELGIRRHRTGEREA